MKKILKLFIVLVLIFLLLSFPVSAGFWDWLAKLVAKKLEKQTIKQAEKATVLQDEKSILKQSEKKLTRSEQIQRNRIMGNKLDDAFKAEWCKTNICVNKISDIQKVTPGETIYITNDWEAKSFINRKFDPTFTRRPDMLKIENKNKGFISGITIYDVKTSADAAIAAGQRGQVDDYVKLCDKLNKKSGSGICSIQYALPKNEAEELAQSKGTSVGSCLAIGFLIGGPDPTDLLCFVSG